MCGITGFYAPNVPIEPWFATACEAARHRGPDGDGVWACGWPLRLPVGDVANGSAPAGSSVALGFTRLAILDLSPAGSQPMVAPGRAAIVLNGEIYNYLELREELAAVGWTFTSTGDAEVLLKGWLAWGEGVFARMNGMWAMAIYDAATDALILSRDRFGEKPLFWTGWRGGVAFASEVKQLRCFPDVSIRVDPHRAAGFLRTGRPYDGASSWFEGVHQLAPGRYMRIDRDGRTEQRYWSLDGAVSAVEPSAQPEDWQRRFAEALSESVRLRLRSDVPIGTSLSRGVDSSAILAEAVRLGHQGYHSFTQTSDDPDLDEGPQAGAFARTMGSTWHPVRVSATDFDAEWDDLTWHQECPVPATSLYGQWCVLRTARQAGVIVLLDGQGADEILGGYHKFMASVVLARARARDLGAVPLALSFARQVGSVRTLREDGYRYLGRLGRQPDLRWIRAATDTAQSGPAVGVDSITMRLADIERWSLPNLLSYVDRTAMAFGVETRLPYLDPQVAALALAMPATVLLRGGWSKWPLRQTLAQRNGAGPAWRRGKRWFDVPQRAWLRGTLSTKVDEWARNPHPMWSELVDPAAMRGYAAGWRERRHPAADNQVFQLVALDRFFRAWVPV